MAQVTCPECGALATRAAGKAYCTKCGWNRGAAEKRLARIQMIFPALIVIVDLVGIVGFGFIARQWPLAILFVTLPTLLLGVPYTNAAQKLKQLRASNSGADGAPSAPGATLAADAQTEIAKQNAEEFSFLLSLPPPRTVRLRLRGKIMAIAVFLIVAVAEVALLSVLYTAWSEARSFSAFNGQEWFIACVAVVVAFLPLAVLRTLSRDHDLLENGSLAMARITGQRPLKNTSSITYEFEDAGGRKFTNSAADLTRSLFEGMTVPVFYDPQKPSRQIASCASFCEVVPPGVD